MSPPADLEKQIEKILATLTGTWQTLMSEHAGISFFYGDLSGQERLKSPVNINSAKPPAISYAENYLDELKRGGTTINREWVPWFEKYGPDQHAKGLYDIIMKGIQEGKPLGRWEFRDAEGYQKNTVARDIQEYMGQQYRSGASRIARSETGRILETGALERYERTGIDAVLVRDGDGCLECAGLNGQTWTIDYAMGNVKGHPNCKRTFTPIVPGYKEPGVKAPSPMPEDDPGSPYYQDPEKDKTKTSERDIVRPGYHQYKFTSEEQAAITYYQGSGYIPINKYLYKDPGFLKDLSLDKEQKLLNTIGHLDSAISKGELTEDIVLYRGFGKREAKLMASKSIGDSLEINGYYSTSKSQEEALKTFAHKFDETDEEGNVISVQRMGIIKGKTGNIVHMMENEFEEEILYPRGNKIKILNILNQYDKEKNSKLVIYRLGIE